MKLLFRIFSTIAATCTLLTSYLYLSRSPHYHAIDSNSSNSSFIARDRTIYSRHRNITCPPLATTPWPKYRLGDMFRSHIFRNRDDGWNLHHKVFNTSLAVEYITRIKDPFNETDRDYVTMIQIINERIDRNKTLQSLLPDDRTLIIHLRTGDVIDKHPLPIQDFLSFDNATASSCDGNWYTRSLPYYAEIWDQIQSEGIQIQRIMMITGWHFRIRHIRSIAYINKVIEFLEQMVERVDIRVNENPDEDFMIMTRSTYFVASGGGFSKSIGEMVERNDGRVFGYYNNQCCCDETQNESVRIVEKM